MDGLMGRKTQSPRRHCCSSGPHRGRTVLMVCRFSGQVRPVPGHRAWAVSWPSVLHGAALASPPLICLWGPLSTEIGLSSVKGSPAPLAG